MQGSAHGTFEVRMQPLPAGAVDSLKRMSIDKEIHGDLEATSTGEMMSAGNPKLGEAGYVAMEVVTGRLGDKSGSFALQHAATMDASGQRLQISVTPGSGTGDFKGMAGSFAITIVDGQHSYEMEYTLPAPDAFLP